MSDPASLLPPAGWYPDPGGQRQWRRWSGREWSESTAPFDHQVAPLASRLEIVEAHRSLLHYGVATLYSGIGLAINTYHYRPYVSSAMTPTLYTDLLIASVILFTIGHLSFVRSSSSLEVSQRWRAGVPLFNTTLWAGYAFLHASYSLPLTPWTLRRVDNERVDALLAVLMQFVFLLALASYAAWPTTSAAWNAIWTLFTVGPPVITNMYWTRLVLDDNHG